MIAINEISKLALRSLLRNKVRSVLTMLGIIIGVSAVILLVSIGQGLQKYITDQFEALGTNIVVVLPGRVGRDGNAFSSGPPNFSGSKFTLKDVDEVNKIGGPIDLVGAGIENPSTVSFRGKSKYTTIGGMTADYAKMRNFTVSEGRMITDSDSKLSRNVIVLGNDLVEKLFGQGKAMGQEVTLGGQKFKVIGILNSLGTGGFGININDFALIPITSAQKVFGIKSVQAIAVKAQDKDSIPEVIKILEKHMDKKYDEDEFSVVDQSNLVASINQILGVVTLALSGIAAISLIVGGVGIMNIMLVTVTERTREIGLRKAVGAKPSDILYQFLIEAVVLSLGGGVIGVLIGSIGSWGISHFISTSVTPWSVILSFGVSALVGIIFGVAPAARASKLNPIEALKYE